MAAKKTGRQVASAARLKDIRSGLAALKRKGLYTGDAKRAKGNSYQAQLVRQNRDVITSKATVLKVGHATARDFKEQGARTKRDKLVVEAAPSERVIFHKKTKAVIGKRLFEGNSVYRNIIYQHQFNPSKLPKPGKDTEFRYRVGFKQIKRGGTTYTPWFHDLADLEAFMNQYSSAKQKSAKAEFEKLWSNSVEIQWVEKSDDDYDEEEFF